MESALYMVKNDNTQQYIGQKRKKKKKIVQKS